MCSRQCLARKPVPRPSRSASLRQFSTPTSGGASLEAVTDDLGAGRWTRFRRVALPVWFAQRLSGREAGESHL